jgi:hypothetical protein
MMPSLDPPVVQRARARARTTPRIVSLAAIATLAALAVVQAPRRARALDKQGVPHHGGGSGLEAKVSLSGNVFVGVLPFNPSYAARPDNSGLALMRAGGHLDVNLFGSHLFIPIDLNLFSDRRRHPYRPSEIDVIGGVASAWDLLGGQIELGARGEVDAPADGVGASQSYVDVRGRYIFALAPRLPGLGTALRGGDVSGWVTLGWFAVNPGYYARPNNTGLALLRYAGHVSVSALQSQVALFLDGTSFTDRDAARLRPSELDLTVGAALTGGAWELQLAYERDMPVDGGGGDPKVIQQTAMVTVTRAFAWIPDRPWNRVEPRALAAVDAPRPWMLDATSRAVH